MDSLTLRTIGLLLMCAICFGNVAQSAEIDQRVKQALEENGLKYSVDSNGLFSVPVEVVEGAGGEVLIPSYTSQLYSLEVRKILALGFEVEEDDMCTLLETNNTYKIGAWEVYPKSNGKWYAAFHMQIPADCDGKCLAGMIKTAAYNSLSMRIAKMKATPPSDSGRGTELTGDDVIKEYYHPQKESLSSDDMFKLCRRLSGKTLTFNDGVYVTSYKEGKDGCPDAIVVEFPRSDYDSSPFCIVAYLEPGTIRKIARDSLKNYETKIKHITGWVFNPPHDMFSMDYIAVEMNKWLILKDATFVIDGGDGDSPAEHIGEAEETEQGDEVVRLMLDDSKDLYARTNTIVSICGAVVRTGERYNGNGERRIYVDLEIKGGTRTTRYLRCHLTKEDAADVSFYSKGREVRMRGRISEVSCEYDELKGAERVEPSQDRLEAGPGK